MKIMKTTNKVCVSCMEKHDVRLVQVKETNIFKGIKLNYNVIYEYCENTDEYFVNEENSGNNDLAMKDAYRREKGLLTTEEIKGIRGKYSLSQKDFARILNWGETTITRYENHQVQDAAHDEILRKVGDDPHWFLQLLSNAGSHLSEKGKAKYQQIAMKYYAYNQDKYLKDYIESIYAGIDRKSILTGYTELDLDKIIEMINFIVSKVESCYKVKLMKLLWYSDVLNFKRQGKAISGMAYTAMAMGALPIGHDQIINLNGIEYEEQLFDCSDSIGYRFSFNDKIETKCLTETEKETMNDVIDKLGAMTTTQIINFMHREMAYKKTAKREIISYEYANAIEME